MPRMTTAEATVESLIQHGIDTIYALPGVHNDALFDALHGTGERIRVLHPRHEQAAGYMALGAALATGRPQVFCVVPGPGLLNAAAALLTAHALGAPVLALVGQIPQRAIDRGYGHLHEIPDQLGLLRHLTKFAARITHPAAAPVLVAEALECAIAGRPRPVALECAIDVWPRTAEVAFPALRARRTPPPEPAAIDAAAAVLARAERPLIVAGAPVLTYRSGRGVLASDHPLAVSLPVGHRLWAETDAVLAVGTRLHTPLSQWGTDKAMRLLRIEIDAEEMERFRRPDVAILADAAPALAALAAALPAAMPQRAAWAATLARHRTWFAERLAKLEPQSGFLAAIRAALPADGVVVADVTQLGFAGRLAFPVAAPRLYLSPGYQDNLGWAYGTALGVQAALPGRRVVALAGDGGFMYQLGELATAVRHRLPVVAIVFDDNAFGNVRRIQAEQYGNRLIACDLVNPDFVALANSFGIGGWRARTPAALQTALTAAFASGAPALIHVPVVEMPSPWDMLILPRVRGVEDDWRVNLP